MILVTGASGFLGQALVQELVKKGYVVTGCIYKSDTDYLFQDQNLSYIKVDISKANALEELLDGYEIDGILHTAAYIDFDDTLETLQQCYNINIQGTANLLEFCRIRNISRFVFSSSVSVYDPHNSSPIKEGDHLQPQSYYGISKLSGEYICQMYRRKFDIKVVILRYAGIYGYQARADMAINVFLNNVLRGIPIVINGDGSQKRDYVYVKDVALANIRCLESDKVGVFNITSGIGMSVREIAEAIKQVFFGKKVIVEYRDEKKVALTDIFFDISSAKKRLNFTPTSLEQVLIEIKDEGERGKVG